MAKDMHDVLYYYSAGEEAFKNKDYTLAAAMYKICWETYEYGELPVYNAKVQKNGEDAFKKYNKVVKKYLNRKSGFDSIEYGV